LSADNNKTKWMYIGLIAILIVLLILSYVVYNGSNGDINPINLLCVDSNELYTKITESWPLNTDDIHYLETQNNENAIKYTIITLDENVVFSNSKTIDIEANQLLNNAFYMDNFYKQMNPGFYKLSQPIYKSNKIVAL